MVDILHIKCPPYCSSDHCLSWFRGVHDHIPLILSLIEAGGPLDRIYRDPPKAYEVGFSG